MPRSIIRDINNGQLKPIVNQAVRSHLGCPAQPNPQTTAGGMRQERPEAILLKGPRGIGKKIKHARIEIES